MPGKCAGLVSQDCPVISNADSLVYGSEMWNEQTKCLCQKAILSQTERETQAEFCPIETIGE